MKLTATMREDFQLSAFGCRLSVAVRGHLGAAGLDVYEEEEGIFFRDLSDQVLQDDVLARLLTFPTCSSPRTRGF